MQNNESLVVPFFKAVAVPDQAASHNAGRPIFRDTEVVEIRIAGERHFAPVFPAHSMWKRIDGEEVTYAQRWKTQYEAFRAGREQIADGTPLSELPFLTEAKRAELRGLKVYTAEALASLDGKNLSNLGSEGRQMKDQAAAYLSRATGSAEGVRLAAEVAALRAELADLRGQPVPEDDAAAKMQIKAQIHELTGQTPRGNPSLETLRETLSELQSEKV